LKPLRTLGPEEAGISQQPAPLRRRNGIRAALAVSVALLALGAGLLATGAKAVRPSEAAVGQLRALTDHYRRVTWEYQRAARVRRTPTSFSYRHSTDPKYLRWTVAAWTKRAYIAQRLALTAIHRRLAVPLPHQPALRASRRTSLAFSRQLAVRLRRIFPGRVSRQFASAHGPNDPATLRLWQERSAAAAMAVAEHAVRRANIDSGLLHAFLCIHRYEGAWDSNTGNGYYGGLQMDQSFMLHYGRAFFTRWGTADRWPAWAQLEAAARAHSSGRGFSPWPNTARACGLV
jgi:hypothetical protein